MADDVRTCADSLLNPGVCCFSICRATATTAVLFSAHGGHLIEHARCADHVGGDQPNFVGAKPLAWDRTWGPKDPEDADAADVEPAPELPEDLPAAEYRRPSSSTTSPSRTQPESTSAGSSSGRAAPVPHRSRR